MVKVSTEKTVEYDVENDNTEDVTFTFTGYKITGAKEADGSDYDYTSNPSTPKIELYDNVFTVDGTGATIVQQ